MKPDLFYSDVLTEDAASPSFSLPFGHAKIEI
jgi:hypothetical protein